MKPAPRGLPNPDDVFVPREPVDGLARRVVGKGVGFSGFHVESCELCSVAPIPIRLRPINAPNLPFYEGAIVGKLTVLGLATIEHNKGWLNRDKTRPTRENERQARKNYQGRHPVKRPARRTGEARWVCRCYCGNYTLRSSKAIRISLRNKDNPSWFHDGCLQCRQLDKFRCGVTEKCP